MTGIERVTKEEFLSLGQRGRVPSPENILASSLQPGEAFKFACRWNHSSVNGCPGSQIMNSYAARHGYRITTRCRDGMLYIMRLEEKI